MARRPLTVAIISGLFVAAGAVGLVYHAAEIDRADPFANDAVWVCFIRLLAIVGGVFLFRGHDWARWLLAAWMAYHIVLSALHSLEQLLVHCALFAVIAWFLFRPQASKFLQQARAEQAATPTGNDPPAA